MKRPSIVQFWDSSPPPDVFNMMESWRTGPCSATFGYERFDDVAAADFIRDHYDQRILRAYFQCGIPAMRADLFRYCYLNARGGVYVDADTTCVAALDEVYAKLDRGLLFLRRGNVANDFMIVKRPHDKLLEFTLEQATVNIEARRGNNVWSITGPGIMTRLFRSETKEAEELFEGLQIVTVGDVAKFVRFNWSLPYKASDKHWTVAQKTKAVFLPD